MPNKKYYSLEKSGTEANLSIYGDITSWPWLDSDVSASNLSRQLEELGDVSSINVYINSYGGEVAEGLAIYNALKRHPAQVTTVCDGFACSIASVIFMAGDKRVMNEASLLMIHNAWAFAEGNAEQLRKQADDLETITNASVAAYLSKVSIEEEELRSLMDAETWLEPSKAVEYGFATEIKKSETDKPSQNARKKVFEMILNPYQAFDEEETEETEETETEETPEEPETEETEVEDPEENPKVEPKEATEEDFEEDPEGEEAPADEETEEDETEEMQLAFLRAIQKL
jgi:ATP-dependent Clp protease protease subunit